MSGYNFLNTSDNGNQNLLPQPLYGTPIPANLFIVLGIFGILCLVIVIILVTLVFKKHNCTTSIEPIQNDVTIHRRTKLDFSMKLTDSDNNQRCVIFFIENNLPQRKIYFVKMHSFAESEHSSDYCLSLT